jgi:hypothetical protein
VSNRWSGALGGMEVAPNSLGDDGDQAELQIGSPAEWLEEKLLGALNGKRDGIRCGDGYIGVLSGKGTA